MQEQQECTSLFWGERVISRGLRALLPIPIDYLALVNGANGAHGLLSMDAVDSNAAAIAALLASVPGAAEDDCGPDESKDGGADHAGGDPLSALSSKVLRLASLHSLH